MALTKIRGISQIMSNSIDLDKLIAPFISSTTGNWDITSGNLDATITGIPDPVNDYDVVNKHYVDSLFASGLAWKAPVRVLSLSNVDITNAPSDIDGVTLNNGDRIGLFGQTTTSEDGVYIFNGAGSPLTRADDWAVGDGAANYTFWVMEGTNYADTQWTVTNDPGSDVIGTDDLVVIQIAGQGTYTFQNALTKTGNTVEWGGALIKNTTVDMSGYNVVFSSNTSSIFEVNYGSGQSLLQVNGNSFSYTNSTAPMENKLSVNGDEIELYIRDTDVATEKRLLLGNTVTGILVNDTYDTKGLIYGGDYSANNIGNNYDARWIPDLAYIDTNDRVYVRVKAPGNVDITNAPSDIDGVTLNNGDLVLLVDQTTSTEDGIYVFNGAGSAMTRAPYFPVGRDIKGLSIFVLEGTTAQRTLFAVANTGTAVLGTDDIILQTIGGATVTVNADNGLHVDVDTVKLGGALTENTSISLNGHTLRIYETTGNPVGGYVRFDYSTGGGASVYEWNDKHWGGRIRAGGNWFANIFDGENSIIKIGYGTSGASSVLDFTTSKGFEISDTTFTIIDSDDSFGMKYDADYSANGMLDDRWIPDWGAVKAYVANATSRSFNEIHDITADTTTITLNNATAGDGKSVQNLVVYVNGVRQAPGSSYDYELTDADAGTITFTYTLVSGDVVVVDYDYA